MVPSIKSENLEIDAALEDAIAREIAKAREKSVQASREDVAIEKTRHKRQPARVSNYETEYHIARLLLLIDAISGRTGSLDGLTKLAKLDFLLRYPVFLEQLAASGSVPGLALDMTTAPTADERSAVESRMIRYKYGPWDDKYYGLIGALVGRGLAKYTEGPGNLNLRPTEGGRAIAGTLARDPAWQRTAARCEALRRAFRRYSGNRLKELIYSQLPEAVDRPHRAEI